MKTIKIKDYYGKYQEIPVVTASTMSGRPCSVKKTDCTSAEIYHCFAADLETIDELAFTTGVDDMIDELIREEGNRRLYESIAKLTPIQRRRVQMVMDNMSYSDIARAEKKNVAVIYRSDREIL